MIIGIPGEIKENEKRVAMTPAGVHALVDGGHKVLVETGAGSGSGFSDNEYINAGGKIMKSAASLWGESGMIIKVKEPLGPELDLMKEGQIIYAYLHLAANSELTEKLIEKKVIGIAYETIQPENGSLPLLAPMSEIAGRLSVQMGAWCLESINGGKGLLLSGVPGVPPARVTILGAGMAGLNATHIAAGMGAQVTVIDVNIERLRYIEDIFHSHVVTMMSKPMNVHDSVAEAVLVIGAVLVPGAKAPKIITRNLLREMEPGSAFVDISIDQGGCAETSRPTTHGDPIFIEENIVHYCVANMPGAVPRTSTFALSNATLKYALDIAGKGAEKAVSEDSALLRGLNIYRGGLTCRKVAEALGMEFIEPEFE